jgi:hypothetical protein
MSVGHKDHKKLGKARLSDFSPEAPPGFRNGVLIKKFVSVFASAVFSILYSTRNKAAKRDGYKKSLVSIPSNREKTDSIKENEEGKLFRECWPHLIGHVDKISSSRDHSPTFLQLPNDPENPMTLSSFGRPPQPWGDSSTVRFEQPGPQEGASRPFQLPSSTTIYSDVNSC